MSSTIVPPTALPGAGRPAQTLADRLVERWASVVLTAFLSVGCLIVLLLLLSVRHSTGGEIDGIAVAALGVGTGVFSLVLLSLPGRHRIALGILVALWVGVALGGISGYSNHAKAISSTSADQRARPPLAPLIFTGFGIAGAAALVVGGRRSRPEA